MVFCKEAESLLSLFKFGFLITEQIESCDFEPPDGATLEPYTNVDKITKGSQIFINDGYIQIWHMWNKIEKENVCIGLDLKNLTHIFTTAD